MEHKFLPSVLFILIRLMTLIFIYITFFFFVSSGKMILMVLKVQFRGSSIFK